MADGRWEMADGRSGLLQATTGAGKTYAVALGALLRAAVLGLPVFGPPSGQDRAGAGAAVDHPDARAGR